MLIKTLALLCLLAGPAAAGPYSGAVISTTTGIEIDNLSGKFNIAASSKTSSTYTIVLDGTTGKVSATTLTLASAPASGYSIDSSTGLLIRAGDVAFPNQTIDEAELHDASISTAKIVDAAVATAKLASDAVITAKIADAAVVTAKLASAAVSTAKIADNAVDTAKLASDSVTGSKILNATIDTAKLNATIQTQLSLAGTVAAGYIDTDKIASDAVTAVKIINAGVTTAKLADSAVDTAKLASDAVTTVKIINAGVTTAKLAGSAVDTAKLASDSVTGSKILNATIDTAKLNATIQAQLGQIAANACVYNSTWTSWGADVTTTDTTTGTIVTGSSVTLTMATAGRLWIRINYPMRNNTGGERTNIGVTAGLSGKIPLQDYATSEPVCHSSPSGGAENYRPLCQFDWTTHETFTAGAPVTVEVRRWASGGTATIDCEESNCTMQVTEDCP